MSIKLTTDRIGDHRIDIFVDSSGGFSAEFNDQSYSASTRRELLEQLQKAVRKAKQQGLVPVTVLGLVPAKPNKWNRKPDEPFESGAGVVDAQLRAQHERQHNTFLLITDDKKTKFQVETWRHRDGVTVARRLTVEEAHLYVALRGAVEVAEQQLKAFTESVAVDPADLLHEAAKAKKGEAAV